jgi:hypothetical protein
MSSVERLKTFHKQKQKEIADEYRNFVKTEFADGRLSEWPKLYYIDQGKGGYNDGGKEMVQDRVIGLTHNIYLHCDTLQILTYDFSSKKYTKASDREVAGLPPDCFDLSEDLEELKASYNEKHSTVTDITEPYRFLRESLLFGLDLSFKDFMSHYKGIETHQTYRDNAYTRLALEGVPLTEMTEKEYLKIKKAFTAKVAHKMLSEKKEKNSRWH